MDQFVFARVALIMVQLGNASLKKAKSCHFLQRLAKLGGGLLVGTCCYHRLYIKVVTYTKASPHPPFPVCMLS